MMHTRASEPVKRQLKDATLQLLLRNASVLQSILEKAEPELSLLELDARRLFILCMVEANAFPVDPARVLSLPKPNITFLIKKLEENGYLRRQGEKGDWPIGFHESGRFRQKHRN